MHDCGGVRISIVKHHCVCMRVLAPRKLVGLIYVELISSLPPVIESNQALTASWRTDLWEGATIKPTEYENGKRYIK